MVAANTSAHVHLGNNIFAVVKTWRGVVKLHIRTYKPSTSTGPLLPTKKGITLTYPQFVSLLKSQKRLLIDLFEHIEALNGKRNLSDDSHSTGEEAEGAAAGTEQKETRQEDQPPTPPLREGKPPKKRSKREPNDSSEEFKAND